MFIFNLINKVFYLQRLHSEVTASTFVLSLSKLKIKNNKCQFQLLLIYIL